MIEIKKILSELRGVLGGYGFATPKTEAGSKVGWDRFLDFEGRGWDYVIEAGLGDPSSEEQNAITSLGYYDARISKKTVAGLKAGRRYAPTSKFSMDIEFPGERGSGPKFFKTKEELIKAANEMGGGEAQENSTDWINDGGARISIEGATYGEVFPKRASAAADRGDDVEHPDDRWSDAETEARTSDAHGSMSSGRYIGQVLGNVISDIEKGRHEDAVGLLRKLKADLEKRGSEVVELYGEK